MAAQMNLEVTPNGFVSADKKPAQFEALLHDVLRHKRVLTARFEAGGIVLSAGRGDVGARGPVLHGAWSTADLQGASFEAIGAKLFLPFLFTIGAVSLPHHQIHTFGHSYRSIADFFMRNLLLGIIRNEPIETRAEAVANLTLSGALRNQYFFIIKAMIADPVLAERSARETVDYLRASTYVPVMRFENTLLRHGAESLRAERQRLANRKSEETLIEQLTAARRAMLVYLTA